MDRIGCKICSDSDSQTEENKQAQQNDGETVLFRKLEDLRLSADENECEICGIIFAGISSMDDQWVEDGRTSVMSDDAEIQIISRLRRSLLVNIFAVVEGESREATLEFFTRSSEDDLTSFFGHANMVEERLSFGQCVHLISDWINTCDGEHTSCRVEGPSNTPRRVLDVGVDGAHNVIRLTEFPDGIFHPYITLSHCWGPNPIIRTLRSNIEPMKSGIPINDLPPTFRDAVTVTRLLGYRFIWIDSLCIIQDSGTDWEVESVKMAQYYHGAVVNLAATHSSGSHGGLFPKRYSLDQSNQWRSNLGEESCPVIVPDEGCKYDYKIWVREALHIAHDQFTRAEDYAQSIVEFSPLLTRAWVLQERMLARRTIHFHAEELIWECSAGLSCECSRLQDHKSGNPNERVDDNSITQLKMIFSSITTTGVSQQDIFDSWLEIVNEYCSLRLTVHGDRLPALSGLASKVAPLLDSDYLAGLWSRDLARQLCWINGDSSTVSFRHKDHRAPSWSWASVATVVASSVVRPNIQYLSVCTIGFLQDSRFAVLCWKYKSYQHNLYSGCDLASSSIQLEGPTICGTHSSSVQKSLLKFGDESSSWSPDEINSTGHAAQVKAGDTLKVILIGRSEKVYKKLPNVSHTIDRAYALVVKEMKPTEETNKVHFVRVGTLHHNSGISLWDEAEVETFHLF